MSELNVRPASPAELPGILALYGRVIDRLTETPFDPLWRRDVYPTREALARAAAAGELLLGEQEGALCAAMVLNRTEDDGWEEAPWRIPAAENERAALHLLAVDPDRQGQGLAKRMAQAAAELSRGRGARVLRLGVLPWNLPAVRCYAGLGFRRISRLTLWFEDTGSIPLDLYELPL